MLNYLLIKVLLIVIQEVQTVEGMCMRFDDVKIEILIGRNKMTRKIGQEVKKMSAKYVPDIRLNTDIRASAIK